MDIFYTTSFPNEVLDNLKQLTNAEYRVLSVIIRQTKGWHDVTTGSRKKRDWISLSQFSSKTGLSRRIVSSAISSLVARELIAVTNRSGQRLGDSKSRRGKKLYFEYIRHVPPHMQKLYGGSEKTDRIEMQKRCYNKRNSTKEKKTKETSIRPYVEKRLRSLLDK
jgi:hypothetical protein